MEGPFVIGVDSSTQSTKAMVFDTHGNIVGQGRGKITTQAVRPGWAEQNPDDWWASLCQALQQATTQVNLARVAALSLAYQRETFVLVDQNFRPLRPGILWLDQRAGDEVMQIDAAIGRQEFRRLTGKFLDTTPSVVKLNWIKNHEAHLFTRLDKILDVGAYLHHRLTGQAVSPRPGVDALGMLDIHTKEWSQPILEYTDVSPQHLPQIVECGEIVGTLTQEAAQATGLPPGLPVVAGGGDGQVFAVGVESFGTEDVALTLGTGLAWGMHATTSESSPYYRTMIGCVPKTYYLESVLRAGSQTVSWFVETMAGQEREVAQLLGTTAEHLLEQESRRVPPGCQGLFTVPYWRGGMMPYNDPHARGVTLGWSDYHTKAHFYRSLLEGMAFELRLVLHGYATEVGLHPKAWRIGGGGAASKLWCEIIADVTGKQVSVSEHVENTALGAALIALWGLNHTPSLTLGAAQMHRTAHTFHPNPENHALYGQLFEETYRHIYSAVRALSAGLGNREL